MDNFSVQYKPNEGFILVCLTGEFDERVLSQSTAQMVEVMSQSKCSRILMDHRQAKPKLSVADLYDRPKKAIDLGVPRVSKIAIVYSEPDDAYEFIETVGRNNGFNVRSFQDLNDATHWLR